MIMDISINKLTNEDFEAAYEVFKITIPYAFGKCDVELEKEDIKAETLNKKRLLQKSIAKDEPVFFVAKHNNKVIGTIAYGPCSEDIKVCTNNEITDLGEIGSLFILPEYQNKGIGSALINYLMEYLKEKGIKEFCLDSGYDKAQKTWTKKFGKPYTVVKDYWAKDVDNMVWICKVKSFK